MIAAAEATPETPRRDVDLRIGRSLRGARTLRGMTQKQLGASVGLSLQQIQKYESGTNHMGASRLHQFAEILGVPVAQFFAGPMIGEEAAPPAPAARASGTAPSADDLELLSLFGALSPRMKRRMICMVEEIAEETRAA